MVMLTSELLKQHRLLEKLAGMALVMSYDLFTRPSETFKTGSQADTTDSWQNLAATLRSRMFWTCKALKNEVHGSVQTPCDTVKKLANSHGKWHSWMPPS